MNYEVQKTTKELINKVLSDSTTHPDWGSVFRASVKDGNFPEGLVIDSETGSYLVVVPFMLRNPESRGEYAFSFLGEIYYITIVAPSWDEIVVQDACGLEIHPTASGFLESLTAAFAAHRGAIRVIDGIAVARGHVTAPVFWKEEEK